MKQRVVAADVFTIEDFLTAAECIAYIGKSEKMGYEAATVETEKGAVHIESVRNNNRILFTDPDLAAALWEKAGPLCPQKIGHSIAVGFNELFRFYKYEPGQQFRKHRDQSYIRNESEASYYTFLIYLNDDYTGGETTFSEVTIQPKTGTALLFRHELEHSGNTVNAGIKYVLRTDILYRLRLQD